MTPVSRTKSTFRRSTSCFLSIAPYTTECKGGATGALKTVQRLATEVQQRCMSQINFYCFDICKNQNVWPLNFS